RATLGGIVSWLRVESCGEPLVGGGRFHRVEILALDVFDERHLEQPLLLRRGDILDDNWNPGELGLLGGAPAALARDDLVSLAAAHRAVEPADHDRLNDAVGLDRSRELVELAGVDRSARLIVIGLELV